MRIAMLALSQYPHDPRIARQAQALARRNVPVDIICLRGSGETKVERFGLITAYRPVRAAEKERLSKYLLLCGWFMIAGFVKLLRLSSMHRYDMLQVHNMPDFLVFIGIWHKIVGTPLVLDLHDLMVELFQSRWGARKARILLPLVRFAEAASCRFADELITTSRGFRDRLIERGVPAAKITLVLNSADDNIFSQSPREPKRIPRGPRILYHGTVAPRFGLHKAIEAVSLLRGSLPETTLEIFGKYDPSYRRELENQVRQLRLGDRVWLREYVSLEKVCEIIRSSDIGLVPYLSDCFMDLALSTKLFEYAAMGLPIVASRLPSIASIFGEDCVKYCEPGNPVDLAQKILEFCKSPESQESFTESAFQAYQHVSWPVMRRRYCDLVERLAGKNDKRGPHVNGGIDE